MSVYMISRMHIHDRDTYQKYADQFMDVFEKFDGKLLSVDDDPKVVAGDWAASRSVLMEFPDKAAWGAWITSPEYQEISKYRQMASAAEAILVESLDHKE